MDIGPAPTSTRGHFVSTATARGGRAGEKVARPNEEFSREADARMGGWKRPEVTGMREDQPDESVRRHNPPPSAPSRTLRRQSSGSNRAIAPPRLTNSQPRIPLASRTHVPPAIPDRHLKPRWGRCQAVVTVVTLVAGTVQQTSAAPSLHTPDPALSFHTPAPLPPATTPAQLRGGREWGRVNAAPSRP